MTGLKYVLSWDLAHNWESASDFMCIQHRSTETFCGLQLSLQAHENTCDVTWEPLLQCGILDFTRTPVV